LAWRIKIPALLGGAFRPLEEAGLSGVPQSERAKKNASPKTGVFTCANRKITSSVLLQAWQQQEQQRLEQQQAQRQQEQQRLEQQEQHQRLEQRRQQQEQRQQRR
jgi:hypothetical protein